jgi:hypothetical protein
MLKTLLGLGRSQEVELPPEDALHPATHLQRGRAVVACHAGVPGTVADAIAYAPMQRLLAVSVARGAGLETPHAAAAGSAAATPCTRDATPLCVPPPSWRRQLSACPRPTTQQQHTGQHERRPRQGAWQGGCGGPAAERPARPRAHAAAGVRAQPWCRRAPGPGECGLSRVLQPRNSKRLGICCVSGRQATAQATACARSPALMTHCLRTHAGGSPGALQPGGSVASRARGRQRCGRRQLQQQRPT